MDGEGLEQLERERLRSLVAGDIDTARRLHADDYELITPGGRRLAKDDYLGLIASGELVYETFEPAAPVAVRSRGDVAIARYEAAIVVRGRAGDRDAGRFWHTDVWERRGGTWQALWSHATRIRKAEDLRLTRAELSRQADVAPERVDALVGIGVLQPQPDGTFAPADLQRVLITDAYERGGVPLAFIERAIREGRMTFDFTDRIYPPASPPSGRRLADLAAELGAGGALEDLFVALGRPRPTLDRPLTLADEDAIRSLVRAWTAPVLAGEPLGRAARLLGDSARRTAEGWINLFMESLALPAEVSARMTVAELRPRLFEPAAAIAQALEPALLWALAYSMEQKLNEVNIESMERALEADGIRRPAIRQPPAVMFADLSGFTRLTEEQGDAHAVGHAAALAAIAFRLAAELQGRFVKQLGDGVMLVFSSAEAAAEAGVRLIGAARVEGLSPLHIGISAGPFIERDGDYFGRTVNLASRLSGVAGPGEVVLNQTAADALGTTRDLVALGPVEMKGLPAPIPVFRLRLDEPPPA